MRHVRGVVACVAFLCEVLRLTSVRSAQVRSALVYAPQSLSAAPEIFLSFHQAELSVVQVAGVHIAIFGCIVLCLSAALCWAQTLLHRDKLDKHPRR